MVAGRCFSTTTAAGVAPTHRQGGPLPGCAQSGCDLRREISDSMTCRQAAARVCRLGGLSCTQDGQLCMLVLASEGPLVKDLRAWERLLLLHQGTAAVTSPRASLSAAVPHLVCQAQLLQVAQPLELRSVYDGHTRPVQLEVACSRSRCMCATLRNAHTHRRMQRPVWGSTPSPWTLSLNTFCLLCPEYSCLYSWLAAWKIGTASRSEPPFSPSNCMLSPGQAQPRPLSGDM